MKITIPEKNRKQIINAIMGLLAALLLLGANVAGQAVYQWMGIEPPEGDLISLGTTHFTAISAEDIAATDDLTVADDLTVTDDVDINGDADIDGTTNLDDVDIDLSASLNIDGHMLDVGTCTTPSTADGDNDACIAAVLEVDGELELDGALDADSTSDFADTATFSKGSGNAVVISAGGTLDVNGVLDAVVGTEHLGIPSVVSTAITYTAAAGGSGTVATIADGEIWLVHDILVHVTANFTATAGDDEALIIGDGNDTDGFMALDNTDLTTTYNEGVTGHAAGWLGKIEANVGVYFDPDGTDGFHNNTFVYAPSGAAETIDWALTCTGDDCTGGAATIYVIYTRIQ